MIDTKNKNILITGGGKGLGRTIAHTLAAQGAKVTVIAREGIAYGIKSNGIIQLE